MKKSLQANVEHLELRLVFSGLSDVMLPLANLPYGWSVVEVDRLCAISLSTILPDAPKRLGMFESVALLTWLGSFRGRIFGMDTSMMIQMPIFTILVLLSMFVIKFLAEKLQMAEVKP